MKFKGSASGETSRSQKATHHTIPFIPHAASGKRGDRKQMDGQLGVRERAGDHTFWRLMTILRILTVLVSRDGMCWPKIRKL